MIMNMSYVTRVEMSHNTYRFSMEQTATDYMHVCEIIIQCWNIFCSFQGSINSLSPNQEKLRAAGMGFVRAPQGSVWPSSRWDISVVDYSGMLIL